MPTAKDRVDGAISVLEADGFPKANIFDAPQAKTDTEAALNAATTVLNAHADIEALGRLRPQRRSRARCRARHRSVNIKPDDVIAVGIGGANSAINEFKKSAADRLLRHGDHLAQAPWLRDLAEPL